MTKFKDIVGLCFIFFAIISIIIAIAAASWMVHVKNTGAWQETVTNYNRAGVSVLKILDRSWETKPFVDMWVTDDTKCPRTHPDEVVYQMWLGTRAYCDCLSQEVNRAYHLDEDCG